MVMVWKNSFLRWWKIVIMLNEKLNFLKCSLIWWRRYVIVCEGILWIYIGKYESVKKLRNFNEKKIWYLGGKLKMNKLKRDFFKKFVMSWERKWNRLRVRELKWGVFLMILRISFECVMIVVWVLLVRLMIFVVDWMSWRWKELRLGENCKRCCVRWRFWVVSVCLGKEKCLIYKKG